MMNSILQFVKVWIDLGSSLGATVLEFVFLDCCCNMHIQIRHGESSSSVMNNEWKHAVCMLKKISRCHQSGL